MRLLLIESAPGNAHQIRADLLHEGHDVLSCDDGHGGPCRGVDHHEDCPLERHVDMAIVARTQSDAHTLAEMGSVCAQRHRVPLVEVDPFDVADDMPSVAVANALATRRVEATYAAAVRAELRHLAAIVDVRRAPNRIHATVQVPASQGATGQQVAAIADRARHALREHDQFVGQIDVAVCTYPDPT